MDLRENSFWMGGHYAQKLVEESSDLARLDDGNFWAISISFEGVVKLARFETLINIAFPSDGSDWQPLEGQWKSSLSKNDYCNYVERIRESVAAGWVYQVNACRQLSIVGEREELASLFGLLLKKNPAPFASFLSLPNLKIASASPELFLRRNGSHVITSPIKGTQPLSESGFGDKDESENIMIVDLMRNDLGQICQPGTVDVDQLLRSEDHPGLRHLVSDVTGRLRVGITWKEILEKLLPAGSISGAPKSSALSVIYENEKIERGPYCGILGWVHGDQAELSVAIRIFWQELAGVIKFGTGAGITWGSDSMREWEETELKAERLISIAGGRLH